MSENQAILSDDEIAQVRNLKSFMGDIEDYDDESITEYELIILTLLSGLDDVNGEDYRSFPVADLAIIRDRYELLQEIRTLGEATEAHFERLYSITERLMALHNV